MTAIVAVDSLVRSRTIMRQSCGLLKNYWYAAATSPDVNARRPIARTILEERIALYRTRAGEPVAILDRCLHRNAPLSEGDLFDDCIGCPYHGWTYDRTGRCVNIPAEGENGGCPSGLALETFPVREQDGLVWVWMGGADHPPDRDPFPMPYHAVDGWERYYMVTEFDNGVTALVENFMDVPHTVFVHKGWFRSRSRKSVDMKVERTADSVLCTYDQPQDVIGFTGRILNPKGLPMTHTDRFYMPNVTRVDYTFGDAESGFVITSQCTPTGPHTSLVFTLISFRVGRVLNPLIRPFLSFYTRRVIDQDVDIMKVHGVNMKHYGRSYTSTPVDTVHVFIESLRDWAEGGGRGPKPSPRTETVKFWI